jgi:transposase
MLFHAKEPGSWVEQTKERRPPNVITVALPNKMVRTIWEILAHGGLFQKEHMSTKLA